MVFFKRRFLFFSCYASKVISTFLKVTKGTETFFVTLVTIFIISSDTMFNFAFVFFLQIFNRVIEMAILAFSLFQSNVYSSASPILSKNFIIYIYLLKNDIFPKPLVYRWFTLYIFIYI